jgi:hypothetical protein
MVDPEETAVTILPRPETEGPEEEGAGPGNFQPWEEEAEEIMAAEAAVAVDSLLGVDRPVLPEVPAESFPVAVAVAGRETTPAPQRM